MARGLALACLLCSGPLWAAVPPEVQTGITSAQTDGYLVGAAVLSAICAVYAIRKLQRGPFFR